MTTKKSKKAQASREVYIATNTSNGNRWPVSVKLESLEVGYLKPIHNWPNKPNKAKQEALVSDFIDHVDTLTLVTRIWANDAENGTLRKTPKGPSVNNRVYGMAQVVARMIGAQAIEAARVGLDRELMLATLSAAYGLDVTIQGTKKESK